MSGRWRSARALRLASCLVCARTLSAVALPALGTFDAYRQCAVNLRQGRRPMKMIRIVVLGLWMVAVSASVAGMAQAGERIGTSTADAPTYVGMFAVHNPTRATIHYEVKWGNGAWKKFAVEPGTFYKHAHSLDQNDRAPAPYLRFDNTGGDGRVTYTMYHLNFKKVGSGGFGAHDRQTSPKEYAFEYAPGGRALDLKER